VEAGLDLVGLDISAAAMDQLAEQAPGRRDRLVHGDLSVLPTDRTYPVVIGIRVFQHGDRAASHDQIRQAQTRVAPGGLFCLRVNSTETDIWPDHEIIEEFEPGHGLTVRYLAGPKRGLLIHFFDAPELEALFSDRFAPVWPLRVDKTPRTPPAPGKWAQFEAIWQRIPA